MIRIAKYEKNPFSIYSNTTHWGRYRLRKTQHNKHYSERLSTLTLKTEQREEPFFFFFWEMTVPYENADGFHAQAHCVSVGSSTAA